MLADALNELRSGNSVQNAKFYREIGTAVVNFYVRQLSNPTLRATLAPLAKLGTDKPLEKMLLTTLASLLVDPFVRSMNASLGKVIATQAKALVIELRAAGQTVVVGANISADTNGVTLPEFALDTIEAGPEAAEAQAERDADQFRITIVPIQEAAKAQAIVLCGMRQRGLIQAWQRWDLNAEEEPWLSLSNKYIDEVNAIAKGFDQAVANLLDPLAGRALEMARLLWTPTFLNLKRIKIEKPAETEEWSYRVTIP